MLIVDSPEDIHEKSQAAQDANILTKMPHLLEPEKDDADPNNSDSDFDDPVNDIAMINTDLPDKGLILNTFTLALLTFYPLYLEFIQVGQTWNKIPCPYSQQMHLWLILSLNNNNLLFVTCQNKTYTLGGLIQYVNDIAG